MPLATATCAPFSSSPLLSSAPLVSTAGVQVPSTLVLNVRREPGPFGELATILPAPTIDLTNALYNGTTVLVLSVHSYRESRLEFATLFNVHSLLFCLSLQ